MSSNRRSHRAFYKRPVIIGIVLVVLIVAGAIVYKKTRSSSTKSTAITTPTSSAYTKGQSSTSTPSSGSTSSGQADSKSATGSTGTTATLLAPSGDFVSNHIPNLGGKPAPNTLTSVCNTTPGAECKITFTNGSVTKELSNQTVDSGGSTYWTNWKLQDVGLTTGSWEVQAVATMNGQTQTAKDAMNLQVNP
jgi:hypothetical protein